MWITRATALITPVCIEIERPGKRWLTGKGRPTAELTQAPGLRVYGQELPTSHAVVCGSGRPDAAGCGKYAAKWRP
jgi:hypothetical protein